MYNFFLEPPLYSKLRFWTTRGMSADFGCYVKIVFFYLDFLFRLKHLYGPSIHRFLLGHSILCRLVVLELKKKLVQIKTVVCLAIFISILNDQKYSIASFFNRHLICEKVLYNKYLQFLYFLFVPVDLYLQLSHQFLMIQLEF